MKNLLQWIGLMDCFIDYDIIDINKVMGDVEKLL